MFTPPPPPRANSSGIANLRMIPSRVAAIAGLFLLTAAGGTGAAGQETRSPNFIFIVADDMRFDMMGHVQEELGAAGRFPCMIGRTPNLDRLAAGGVRFRNAFVVNSLCSPSRAAFLTGRYNHDNLVVNNHMSFPSWLPTHAGLLRKAGYRTGYFGKWHMGLQTERPGFDRHASFLGQGQYVDATFQVDGVLRGTKGWVDDVTANFATTFIRNHAAAPFSIVVGFKSPHDPTTPPARLATLFEGVTIAPPANLEAFPPFVTDPVVRNTGDVKMLNYLRCIVGIDENVGKILRALDNAGIADDTVVVFASDNGYFLGEHSRGDKRLAYEESIRIPLLFRYPRLGMAGRRVDGTVLNIDLAPTWLDLAGLPAHPAMQGKSWMPLVRGETPRLRWNFLYEYFREDKFEVPTMVGVRSDRWKLVRYPGHASWEELYNIAADPGETANLARDPARAADLDRMRNQLAAQKLQTRYRVPSTAD